MKTEWPAAVQRLESSLTQVQGTARLWSEQPGSPKRLQPTEARFAKDHGMEKVELAAYTDDPKPILLGSLVYCIGKGTAFRINKRPGAKEYEVQGIGARSNDDSAYRGRFGQFLNAAYSVGGFSMMESFKDEGFEILSAEPTSQGGRELIKVESFNQAAPEVRIGLMLDPNLGWAIRSGEVRAGEPPRTSFAFAVEYDNNLAPGAIPLPRHVEYNDGRRIEHCEFTNWIFAPTPAAEFNMTHYGLPDLVHAKRPRNGLAYWLFGSAIVAGILALALWRMASRGPRVVKSSD